MSEVMPEMELSWNQVLRIWWLIMWRMVIGALVLAALFGFVVGTVGEALSASPRETMEIIRIGAIIITYSWGVVGLRMALTKQYRYFRIAMLPRFYDERPAWLQNPGIGPAIQGNRTS
jgi:hypothetical protein